MSESKLIATIATVFTLDRLCFHGRTVKNGRQLHLKMSLQEMLLAEFLEKDI